MEIVPNKNACGFECVFFCCCFCPRRTGQFSGRIAVPERVYDFVECQPCSFGVDVWSSEFVGCVNQLDPVKEREDLQSSKQ